jgi:hypothetical protein
MEHTFEYAEASARNGETAMWQDGSEFSSAIFRAAQLTGVPAVKVQEIAECFEESGLLVTSERPSIMGTLPLWMRWFLKILRYIKKHPYPSAIYAVLHAINNQDLDEVNDRQNQSQFAASIGVSKAAICDEVKQAQEFFGLPPRQDQRKEEACEKMKARRLAQCKRRMPS